MLPAIRLPWLATIEGTEIEISIESKTVPALNRITSDAAVMNGQPCIRGMRLTVRRVLEALATYPDRGELLAEYPELEDEDIRQALTYAAASLDDKVLALQQAE